MGSVCSSTYCAGLQYDSYLIDITMNLPVALTSTSTMLPIAHGAIPGGGTATNLGNTLKKYLPSTLQTFNLNIVSPDYRKLTKIHFRPSKRASEIPSILYLRSITHFYA